MNEANLTRRQHQVLFRMALGESNKEIGAALGITDSTVKWHVHDVAKKFGLGGTASGDQVRVKSVVRGLQLGLLQLDSLKVTP